MSAEHENVTPTPNAQPLDPTAEPMRSPLKPLLVIVAILIALLVFGSLDR